MDLQFGMKLENFPFPKHEDAEEEQRDDEGQD
jgi:hypothetical protein